MTASGTALMLRWNGTALSQTRLPSSVRRAGISGVSAARRSGWAVGTTVRGKTLILRWNGASWRQVRSPSPASGSYLFGVTVTSARSAWAVGCDRCYTRRSKTLIAFWNGSAWK